MGLYQFNSHEIEISGMVHPNYRRRGIFTELVKAAKEEIRQRGVSKLIYMNQKGSASGQLFLEALGAIYTFSEYWMKIDEIERPLPHMTAVCFKMDEAEMLESMTKRWDAGGNTLLNLMASLSVRSR